MNKFKKPVIAVMAGAMLLAIGTIPVRADLCAVTTCEDVARNSSSSSANSSTTSAWRSVTLRAQNSSNSNIAMTARAQFRTGTVIFTWNNDVGRTVARGANTGDVNATAFASGSERRWRARIEVPTSDQSFTARVTATARVTRRTP